MSLGRTSKCREPDAVWVAKSKTRLAGGLASSATIVLEVGSAQPWTSQNLPSLQDDAHYWIEEEDAELVVLIGLQTTPPEIIANPQGAYPPHQPDVALHMAFEIWQKRLDNGRVLAVQIVDVRALLFPQSDHFFVHSNA